MSLVKSNKDLKKVNVYSIKFNNKLEKPVAEYSKKNKSWALNMSDFATQNNIYAALKQVPLK